jgi:hypothetical protein
MSAIDEAFPCVTRLKETIHYLGKSVEGVAADLGISTRNMYNYVNGKVVVPEDLRPTFAAYLHCEQAFLFPHPSLWLSEVVRENQAGPRVQEKDIVKRRNFIALGAGAIALPAIASDTALRFAYALAIETAIFSGLLSWKRSGNCTLRVAFQ